MRSVFDELSHVQGCCSIDKLVKFNKYLLKTLLLRETGVEQGVKSSHNKFYVHFHCLDIETMQIHQKSARDEDTQGMKIEK